MNKYPYIFVHGFNGWGGGEGIDKLVPYWGGTTGSIIKYLRNNGYESYSASVGPFSSAWDRACELYAQIKGTRVDYGAVHSKKFNHERYGRNYALPMVKRWGRLNEDGELQKVVLIGHSFGAATIRLLVYLLEYGSEEEKAGTPEGELSPLFEGGKKDWVDACVTICGVHNSASTYQFTQDFHIFTPLQFLSAMYAGLLGRSFLNGSVVDFHLEQFGITDIPGTKGDRLYWDAIMNFMRNSDDSCEHDLTPTGMRDLNNMIETGSDVYYFSYPFCSTFEDPFKGMTWPRLKSNPVIAPIACYIGHHREFKDPTTGQVYDKEWRRSDSLCNTISETYPFDEPHTDYDPEKKPERGIWNVMPVQTGDHGQAIGLFEKPEKTRKFYLELAKMLEDLEK